MFVYKSFRKRWMIGACGSYALQFTTPDPDHIFLLMQTTWLDYKVLAMPLENIQELLKVFYLQN